MKKNNVLLLSIRPKHAEHLFRGSKTVELRRIRPGVKTGDHVLVYISSPKRALGGVFEVADVVNGTPNDVWRKCGSKTSLTIDEFRRYFAGTSMAYGIIVSRVRALGKNVPLSTLREQWPGFHPPQGYRYLTWDEVDRLGARRNISG